jgi:hypothetical protein
MKYVNLFHHERPWACNLEVLHGIRFPLQVQRTTLLDHQSNLGLDLPIRTRIKRWEVMRETKRLTSRPVENAEFLEP